MKVDILNKRLEFNTSEEDFENIIYTIFKEANKKGRFIDYIIADGITIKDNFLSYIEKNIDNIDYIKVVSMSLKQSLDTSIIGFNDFFIEQIKNIDTIIKTNDENFDLISRIEIFLEGLQIISFQFNKIDTMPNLNLNIPNYELWNEFAVEFIHLMYSVPNLDYFLREQQIQELKKTLIVEIKPSLIKINQILLEIMNHNIK